MFVFYFSIASFAIFVELLEVGFALVLGSVFDLLLLLLLCLSSVASYLCEFRVLGGGVLFVVLLDFEV